MIPEPRPVARPGTARPLEPGLRVVCAPNPSAMTGPGTNTYLLGGSAGLAVIDPGPADAAHLEALLAAIGGAVVSHIVVTHAHRDHSALAPALAARTGAPVCAFGDAAAGRRADLGALAALGGGEGVDAGFRPDLCLPDGAVLAGPGWQLEALHTPGHMGNHLCLAWNDTVFSGDHVMGWASSLISPPDGDLGAYMASLARLAGRAPRRLWPGHGAPVDDPPARIAALAAHRAARCGAVRAVLARGPANAATIAAEVYAGLAPGLMGAARRNTLAQLIALADRAEARPEGPLCPEVRFVACTAPEA